MAQTTDFMILGFAVIFGSIGIHLWSLVSRTNRAKKDLAMFEELKKEE